MITKPLAALVSLLLLSCGGPLLDEADRAASEAALKAARLPKQPRATWAVQVTDSQLNPVFATNFPVATTYDVYAAFDIPVMLSGQHAAAFEFLSPDGAVYQRTEVPFSSGSATSYRVWTSMPVSGTWIQQFSMTGTWTVQVFLDAEAAPRASRAISFQ